MFLFWGPDLTCFYNDAYRPSLGEDGKHPYILGLPGKDAWPEIWHIIKPLIDQVVEEGKATWSEDQLIPIYRNGRIENVYWTFSYSRVIDEDGKHAGVFVTCSETTEKVRLLEQLRISEQRFQNLVRQSALGIIVLSGADLYVEIVNNAYGQLIEKTPEELIHRPLFEVIPEAAPHFKPIIDQVWQIGEPIFFDEHPYFYYNGDIKANGFLNLIYQPYKEADGRITGVMVLCQDVTEQVNSRKKIETALEQLRLSKEAAQLGTFDLNLETGTMEWDERCRTLFGISDNHTVTYERDFVGGLHPDDKDRITGIIDNLYRNSGSHGDYDVEYRTVGLEDKLLRWVRAKGKVYYEDGGKAVRFIGSVLEITDQKLDELRKNDFIGMVSHELKTPLTSLSAYMEILLDGATGNDSDFRMHALEKAKRQVKKMIGLVRGFLDLARFESGKPHLEFQKFSLNRLIEDTVADLQPIADGAFISFLPSDVVEVIADRDKIESVLTNLLTNAIKYSLKNKEISVQCRLQEEYVIVSIADTGVGIPLDDLENIFDKFYRVESELTKNVAGFGIGLHLSKEIIHYHCGQIWATSKKGVGSTFYFSLPLPPPPILNSNVGLN